MEIHTWNQLDCLNGWNSSSLSDLRLCIWSNCCGCSSCSSQESFIQNVQWTVVNCSRLMYTRNGPVSSCKSCSKSKPHCEDQTWKHSNKGSLKEFMVRTWALKDINVVVYLPENLPKEWTFLKWIHLAQDLQQCQKFPMQPEKFKNVIYISTIHDFQIHSLAILNLPPKLQASTSPWRQRHNWGCQSQLPKIW